MGKCIASKFNGSYIDNNLPFFGMAVGYIDTLNASSDVAVSFSGSSAGVKIIDGGTFADGTSEITGSAETKYVAPNKLITFLYPKYTCVPNIQLFYTGSDSVAYSQLSINFDDLNFSEVQGMRMEMFRFLNNRKKLSGDISNMLNVLDKTYLTDMSYVPGQTSEISGNIGTSLSGFNKIKRYIFSGSKVSGNINDTFSGNTVLTRLAFDETNVSGNVETILRNIMQEDTAAFKARNNTIIFNFYKTNVTSTYNLVSGTVQFTASKTVNIIVNNVTVLTYDIDTDTFTPCD